jgi:DNA-binding NarL/FixJ family response regulator
MPQSRYNNILIIDEMPLIAQGIENVLRSEEPGIKVEYAGNVFHVLSAKAYDGRPLDLVILGDGEDHTPGSLLLPAAELTARFPGSRIMILSTTYEPLIIEKMSNTGIGAYVHKHEDIQVIKQAWRHLSAGDTYVSPIFETLYSVYRLSK